MADPNGWLSRSLLLNQRNRHGSSFKKNPADDLSAVLPHRDTWRTGPVGVRSCRARHCEFAVVRSLQPSLGDTADARESLLTSFR